MESMFRRMFKGAEGWLVIFTAPDLDCYPFKYPEEVAAASAKAIGMPEKDVYFGINLQKEKPAPGKRGKSEDVGVTFGLWQEFDIGGDGCIPDEKTLVKFLNLLEVPDPSLLVHSGGGWHAYWVLEAPMTDVEVISGLEPRFQKALAALFNNEGWKLDSVFDMARVLRVPGTTNHKQTTPRPVKLLNGDGPSYDLPRLVKMVEDLETKAAKVAASTARAKAALPAVAPASDGEMAKDWFEIDGVKYPITERRRRYRNMLMSNKFPRSVSGAGGHKRMFHAACLRHGFALTIDEARPILEEYSETKCDPPWTQAELEHKLEDSVKFSDEKTGWLLPDGREKIVIEESDGEDSDGHPPLPPEPTQQELYDLCRGTIYEPFVYEAQRVIPEINVLMPISGAITLMSAWMSPCLRIGPTYEDSFIPWSYVIYAAASTSGKGTVSYGVEKCIKLAGIKSYNEGSGRWLLKTMGSNPWSVLFASELKDYLKERSWQRDVLDNLKKAADGRPISQSTSNSGALMIENANPSAIFEIQPDLFLDPKMAQVANELHVDGFTNRCLPVHVPRTGPEKSPIGDLSEKIYMDAVPIHGVFVKFFDWLPERLAPAEEAKKTITVTLKNGQEDEREVGSGEFLHPRAELLLSEEREETSPGVFRPYKSIIQSPSLSDEDKSHLIRIRKHYLPIMAIPFETKENLKAGVISIKAMKKAEKLLLAFWYSSVRFQGLIPMDWNDARIKRILNFLNRQEGGESTLGRVSDKCGRLSKTTKDFNELLEHGASIGAWRMTQKTKSGNTTIYLIANNAYMAANNAKEASPEGNLGKPLWETPRYPILYRRDKIEEEEVSQVSLTLETSSGSSTSSDDSIIGPQGNPPGETPVKLNDLNGLQQKEGFPDHGKPPEPIGEFEF